MTDITIPTKYLTNLNMVLLLPEKKTRVHVSIFVIKLAIVFLCWVCFCTCCLISILSFRWNNILCIDSVYCNGHLG